MRKDVEGTVRSGAWAKLTTTAWQQRGKEGEATLVNCVSTSVS